jgi:hypothetical protein
MSLFRRRASPARAVIVLHLNARLQPMHRGALEDGLQKSLTATFPSSNVVGGGTLLSPEHRILSCDIELGLGDPAVAVGQHSAAFLERAGAPVGSWWKFGDGEPVPFGQLEAVALRITPALQPEFLDNGVPSSTELEGLIGRLTEVLGNAGSVVSWDMCDSDTEIFVHGASALVIRSKVQSLGDTLRQTVEFEEFATGS